jgi:hypothetical protein
MNWMDDDKFIWVILALALFFFIAQMLRVLLGAM